MVCGRPLNLHVVLHSCLHVSCIHPDKVEQVLPLGTCPEFALATHRATSTQSNTAERRESHNNSFEIACFGLKKKVAASASCFRRETANCGLCV